MHPQAEEEQELQKEEQHELDPTSQQDEEQPALVEQASGLVEVEEVRKNLASLVNKVVAKAGEASTTDAPAPEVSGGGGQPVGARAVLYSCGMMD